MDRHPNDPVYYQDPNQKLLRGIRRGITDMIECKGGCPIIPREKRISSVKVVPHKFYRNFDLREI